MNMHVALSEWITGNLAVERRSFENIYECIQKVLLISKEDILSKSRIGDIIEARHTFIYISREKMKYPLMDISREMNLDHHNVKSALESFNNRISSDYNGIFQKLESIYFFMFPAETVGKPTR